MKGTALADLGADELIEVRRDVEEDPVDGSGEGDSTEEEDDEHEVRIGGGEVHHLQEKGGVEKTGSFNPLFSLISVTASVEIQPWKLKDSLAVSVDLKLCGIMIMLNCQCPPRPPAPEEGFHISRSH